MAGLAAPAMAAPPPLVVTDAATDLAEGGATLRGRVNPQGSALTDCRFEYGTSAAYGASAPCVPSVAGIGSGAAEVAVSAPTQLLDAGQTYHFRLVASNDGGTPPNVAQSVAGANQAFATTGSGACPNASIRHSQGVGSVLLPDCMALEQVSPPKKGNQLARSPLRLSPDGQRLVFTSIATLGNCPNVNGISGDLYVAGRGDSGWDVDCATPPYDGRFGPPQSNFSPDLTSWFQVVGPGDGSSEILLERLGQPAAALSPSLRNPLDVEEKRPVMLSASADHTHLLLQPPTATDRAGYYLPGDPQPAGVGEDANLYVARSGPGGAAEVELVARDLADKVWGGNCGARLGGIEPITGSNLNLRNGERSQGAISADGSRIYFSTRPAQPESGPCDEVNKKRIMVREETLGGPSVEELISSECARVAPACSTVDGDELYQGASVDQSKVYFTTTRQLVDSDLDEGAVPCDVDVAVAGCDLYLYDSGKPLGERLTQVSAGDDVLGQHDAGVEANVFNSVAAISADGSRAYFVARGVLTEDLSPRGLAPVAGQPNFYTWDADSESIDFIGTLSANDGGSGSGLWGSSGTWSNGAYPVPSIGKGPGGGDGRLLLFKSSAPLTADDTDGGFRDVFLYDTGAEPPSIERISRGEPGGSDNGPFGASPTFGSGNSAPSTDYAVLGRPISEDGRTIAFTSAEGLLPGDPNGAESLYLWRNGNVSRLPGSTSGAGVPSNVPSVAVDGATLAYHSTKQLLPSDGDSTLDVYVARVNGGYPIPVPPQPCQVDEGSAGAYCHGSPGAAPTSQVGGPAPPPGNLPPPPPCAKGKVRKGDRCVRKKAKKSKTKKSKKEGKRHQGKRAGANKGGKK